MEIRKQDLIDICKSCYEAGFNDGCNEETEDWNQDEDYCKLIRQLNEGELSFVTDEIKGKLTKYRVTEVLKTFHFENIWED